MTLFGLEQAQATSDDYYTPAWVFDLLGLRFDLDVCAPPGGVPWIPADRFFTMADDGLTQDWYGRVWMNPPFSDAASWWRRFVEHSHGIALMPLVKSRWVSDMWAEADALVLWDSADAFFARPGGGTARAWPPVILAAFGEECVSALRNLGRTR